MVEDLAGLILNDRGLGQVHAAHGCTPGERAGEQPAGVGRESEPQRHAMRRTIEFDPVGSLPQLARRRMLHRPERRGRATTSTSATAYAARTSTPGNT